MCDFNIRMPRVTTHWKCRLDESGQEVILAFLERQGIPRRYASRFLLYWDECDRFVGGERSVAEILTEELSSGRRDPAGRKVGKLARQRGAVLPTMCLSLFVYPMAEELPSLPPELRELALEQARIAIVKEDWPVDIHGTAVGLAARFLAFLYGMPRVLDTDAAFESQAGEIFPSSILEGVNRKTRQAQEARRSLKDELRAEYASVVAEVSAAYEARVRERAAAAEAAVEAAAAEESSIARASGGPSVMQSSRDDSQFAAEAVPGIAGTLGDPASPDDPDPAGLTLEGVEGVDVLGAAEATEGSGDAEGALPGDIARSSSCTPSPCVSWNLQGSEAAEGAERPRDDGTDKASGSTRPGRPQEVPDLAETAVAQVQARRETRQEAPGSGAPAVLAVPAVPAVPTAPTVSAAPAAASVPPASLAVSKGSGLSRSGLSGLSGISGASVASNATTTTSGSHRREEESNVDVLVLNSLMFLSRRVRCYGNLIFPATDATTGEKLRLGLSPRGLTIYHDTSAGDTTYPLAHMVIDRESLKRGPSYLVIHTTRPVSSDHKFYMDRKDRFVMFFEKLAG